MYIEMLFIKFIKENIKDNKNDEITTEKDFEDVVIEIDESSTKIIDPFSSNKLTKDKDFVEENKEVKTLKVKSKNLVVEKKIINLDEIMNVRLVNTLLNGKKSLKSDEIALFDELKNNSLSIDGPIINNILDGEIMCVSPDCVVLVYHLESIMDQVLNSIEKVTSIYNKYTSSNKDLCVVSDKLWKEISSKYAECFKNKTVEENFKLEEEPKPIYEEVENDDIISSSANELFGDIVENV